MNVRGFFLIACLSLCGGIVSADTIYLQENAKGNQGEVLEEYPDAIVIRFPKNEIKRIEASEKPPMEHSSSLPKVIWVDDGETITLRLPKQNVQVSGDEDLKAEVESIPRRPAAAAQPAASIREMLRRPDDRVIQGKILSKGEPLAGCEMRILRVTDSAKDKLLEIFAGSGEKMDKESFGAVTDEHGIYTFTDIPYGEYILYWKPAGVTHWIRRLSENPDITLVPGRPVSVRDIETNVRTVN